MSATTLRPMPQRVAAYALIAVLAVVELVIFWLMLHPDVPPEYRAYYIDRTNTCLPQPVAGTYQLGQTISFRSDGWKAAEPLKPCGWFGPNGDGTPSKGHEARLRFALGPVEGALRATLQLEAIEAPDEPVRQHVAIYANDTLVEELVLDEKKMRRVTFEIPPGTVGTDGLLELRFALPDAVNFGPPGLGSPTQNRAIQLVSARVAEAG